VCRGLGERHHEEGTSTVFQSVFAIMSRNFKYAGTLHEHVMRKVVVVVVPSVVGPQEDFHAMPRGLFVFVWSPVSGCTKCRLWLTVRCV
jgi:hypothetical protein